MYGLNNTICSGKKFQVFIGGKGTKTSLGCASEHNMFTQVNGTKHWFLYPPISRSPNFYCKLDPDKRNYKA